MVVEGTQEDMRSRIQDLLGDDPSQGRYSDDIYPSEKMGGHLRRARLKIFFSEYSKARERRISLGELAREKKISMVELEEKERCPLNLDGYFIFAKFIASPLLASFSFSIFRKGIAGERGVERITMDHSWFAVYLTLGCLVVGVLPQYREKNTIEVAFECGSVRCARQKGNNEVDRAKCFSTARRAMPRKPGYAVVAPKGYNR
uniref:Uncharacterized protein n=1 Tax=Vespula pensylvanica TaxID=30213 RepID=A0A834P318_VESPE|nr:hypothetical protein H0235_006588 [Vespula pensylvanica]